MSLKRFVTFILTLYGALLVPQLHAGNDKSETFGFATITNITDGYFGSKRIYYSLKCNETFISTLTDTTDSRTLLVGILRKARAKDCNASPRQEWARITPKGQILEPVVSFDNVWECRGICYIVTDPEIDPYQKVVKYGSREEQARARLPCSPDDQIEMVCRTIELEN